MSDLPKLEPGKKYLAIDFDGTCVEHMYPEVGKDVPGAIQVLKDLVAEGHFLILWTMRDGKEFEEAVQWFWDNDIELYGMNNNPSQWHWTKSDKAYAHIYIDDAALGCPLRLGIQGDRPMVDWLAVRGILTEKGILLKEK